MRHIRLFCLAGAVLLTAALSCQPVLAASSAGVVSAALSQLGYAEGKDEFTKYGQWYGDATGYWCDMFVSWCASQAGVSADILPRAASCTKHMRRFQKMGRYQPSAARGGSYLPRQGDLIFFFDPVKHPKGETLNHVGIVLLAEDGFVYAVEGNTEPNRLDYTYFEAEELFRANLDAQPENPDDYVMVKHYPLDSPHIHGYAVPAYDDRTPLELSGFVDLTGYEQPIEALCAAEVLSGTSEHIFSPDYGMSRGEFLTAVTRLCGLTEWSGSLAPFDDVGEDSPFYAAAMAAREAGIIQGIGDNRFAPDRYISPAAVQDILSRLLERMGLEAHVFSLPEGYNSFAGGPYVTRADIAAALYEMQGLLSEAEPAQPETPREEDPAGSTESGTSEPLDEAAPDESAPSREDAPAGDTGETADTAPTGDAGGDG